MRSAIRADHGGWVLKAPMVADLQGAGHQVLDLGAYALNPTDDYPDFAHELAHRLLAGEGDLGVLVCGTGIGMAMAAMIKMIATTISNSISEKPFSLFLIISPHSGRVRWNV